MFGGLGARGGGRGGPRAITRTVLAGSTGIVTTLSRLVAGSTWGKVSGTPTIDANGAISLTSGLADGASTTIVVSETLGNVVAQYPVTLTGQAQASAGTVSIGNATVTEGNSGTVAAVFTVTRSGGTLPFDVNWATANGTATAGVDYAAASGILSFGSGDTTKTITVLVSGDTTSESAETFYVDLSGATNGATIGTARGTGTITDDDAAAPSVSRTQAGYLFGSSTTANQKADATTNHRGNPVDPALIGTNIRSRALALTSGPETITNLAESGITGSTIRNRVQTNAALCAGKTVMFQLGGNLQDDTTQIYDTESRLHGYAIDIMQALAPANAVLYAPSFDSTTLSKAITFKIRNRGFKMMRALGGNQRGMVSMQDVILRWAGPERLAADTVQQFDKDRPFTLAAQGSTNPDVHCTSLGLRAISDGTLVPLDRAKAGGPAWIVPSTLYYGEVTGAGQKVCDLQFFGDPAAAGQSFSFSDSRLQVVVTAGVPGLWLTGAAPTESVIIAGTITSSKGGETVDSPVTVSVNSTVGTAPCRVRMLDKNVFSTDEPIFTSNARQFTLVWIAAFQPYTGANPNVPAGQSDTTLQYIFQLGNLSLNFYRNAATDASTGGTYAFFIRDTSSPTSTTSRVTTNNISAHRTEHGTRMYMISIDLDAGVAKWGASGGTLTNGTAYAATTGNLTIGGTGDLDLTRATTTTATNRLFGLEDNGSTPNKTQFFNGDKHLLWAGIGYIDPTVPANRDLFFNSTTRQAVDLGADGTVAGITPRLFLRGCAAAMRAGSTTAHDSESGYATMKNHAPGGRDFMGWHYGSMVTLP